jgi:hypothetical protein
MDEGPGGELTPHKLRQSAKRPVVQSPGSEQEAPPKQKQRMVESTDAELEDGFASLGEQGDGDDLPPRDPVCCILIYPLIPYAHHLCRRSVGHVGRTRRMNALHRKVVETRSGMCAHCVPRRSALACPLPFGLRCPSPHLRSLWPCRSIWVQVCDHSLLVLLYLELTGIF